MYILYWSLLIVGGFLLGGVMFSQLIPQLILKKDLYKISVDNNPGAYNAFKHCGKKVGMLCLVLDVLKGFIPVFIASMLLGADSFAFCLVMVAPALGHAVGVFNHFHGGKCIASSFGIMIALLPITFIPIVALAALYIVFSTVVKIANSAKRSVVVYILFMVIVCTVLGFLKMTYVAIGCGLVALLPVVRFLFTKKGLVDNRFNDEEDEELKQA